MTTVAPPTREAYGGATVQDLFLATALASYGVLVSPIAKFVFVGSDHTHAGAGKEGIDPNNPLDTIEEAVGECVADRGDIIVIYSNHLETVIEAGGLDIDVDGITLIGLGNGNARPQINFTTAVGADVDVAAAEVTAINLRFTGGIDALTGPVDIDGDDVSLFDCVCEDVTGQATDFMIVTGDRVTVRGFEHRGDAAAGADSAIQITGAANFVLEDFIIDGNFAVACIEGVTTVNPNVLIRRGYLRTRNAADIVITLVATDTGQVGPDLFIRLADNAQDITECLVGDDIQFFLPIEVVNADGELSLPWNGTASIDA